MTDLMAPAFDFDELPDPPARDELLDKVEAARRRALHLPDPEPEPELEVEQLPPVECPICGCDVRGWAETVGDDGHRRWTQPITEAQTSQSRSYLAGGLTHIEGGKRCLSDAKDRTR